MTRFIAAQTVLTQGVQMGAFPAAVIEVGHSRGVLWQQAFGTLAKDNGSPPATLDTVFDLASLTKVLATTTLVMTAVSRGAIKLDSIIRDWLPNWRGSDRSSVTIRNLLDHSSGLTAHLPFFRDHNGREEFERAICTMPLEYVPRSRSLYSDLGFILLGFILEDLYSETLGSSFQALTLQHGWGELQFRPPSNWAKRTAPTEIDPWRGRLLVGEVHDENAWALGGMAGHSGLFGTAPAVGSFARTIACGLQRQPAIASADAIAAFLTQSNVPNSSRALGWDTMRTTSSCGTRMSSAAFGHTGFTGTSLWVEPNADLYVVLLTNRVHPTRENNSILDIRPALHDAVMDDLN